MRASRSWGSRLAALHRRHSRNERGVVAILIALVTCFTVVPLAALAVDVGVQRVARRDVQSVADVVALDLARQLDGRKYTALMATLPALANKSAARNSAGTEAPTVSVEVGMVDDATWTASSPDSYFTKLTTDAGGTPNAVRVTARSGVSMGISGSKGGVERTAIARADDNACFRLGSFAARVATSGGLLNSLINDSLNLTVVGYQGLATSSLTLGALAAELGAGTPDELMKLDNLSLGTLFGAAATALTKNGGSAANITLLNQLANASFSGVTKTNINFNDIIGLTSGADSALASSINLYDLVATTAFVANGTNALAIPDLTVGIPGLLPNAVTASLKVIQAPERKCGRVGDSISTSQVTLSLRLNIPQTGISLGLIGLLTTSSTLDVNIDLAKAKGTLTKIVCGPGATDGGIDVKVDSDLAKVGSALHSDLKLIGLTVGTVDVSTGATAASSTSTVSIRVPPDSYTTPKSTGSSPVATNINNITSGDVANPSGLISGVLGTIVAGLNSGVVNAFANPLIANLNNALINPLSQALGLHLGGADVYAVQRPTCGDVSLGG